MPAKLENGGGGLEEVYLNFIYQPSRNSEGEIDGILVHGIDVTEQVLARKTIEESESYFQRLTDTVPAIIWITQPDGSCSYLNKLWYDYTGQTEEEARGFGWLEVIHPDDKEHAAEIFIKANSAQKPFSRSYRLRNSRGEYRWIADNGSPKFSADNVYEGMIGTVVDVHEEKLAEKALLLATEKQEETLSLLESLLENAPVGIAFFDKEHRYLRINDTLAESNGIAASDHIGKPINEVLPVTGVQVVSILDKVAQTGIPILDLEVTGETPKQPGIIRNWLTGFYPVFNEKSGEVDFVGAVVIEITDRVKAEEKLAYRTALLEAHNQASVDGILLVDAKGKIISFNQRFIEIWNVPQHIVDAKDDEAVLLFAMTQLVNPQLFIDKVKYHYEHPTEISLDELDFKDGKIVERNGYPVIGDDGIYYAWSWTFRDITKQKNYEKTIIESEQRFRTLAQTLPQLIWMTDEKGAYEYASSHWINYSGLDPYAGDIWGKLVHPHDLESLAQGWESSLKTGKTFNSEARIKNKNGMYSWHLVQGVPIKSEQGTIIKWIGAFTDIENLKEEQKQKNDFLSMASHELKTPVTTIKAYGQILERILEAKGDLETLGMAKKMGKQVVRLTTLISDLLNVSKMQKGGLIHNQSVFNFNEMIKEVIDDLQKTIVTHQIMNNLDAEINISGDKDKLGQVLNNLISNATKYSPVADKIIVSTQIVNDGVQLSVQDFGIGISTEEQHNVFEQFYRVTGENQSTFQGMGIGLYICAEIIKREGGKIWVESATGKGSVFYVWLPISKLKKL